MGKLGFINFVINNSESVFKTGIKKHLKKGLKKFVVIDKRVVCLQPLKWGISFGDVHGFSFI